MTLFPRGLDPFNELFDLQRGIGSVFQRPEQRLRGPARSRAFPPMNVLRDQDGYRVELQVPGVSKDGLSVEATGRTLTISVKREPRPVEGESTHRLERWSGEFARAIRLPEDADTENIEATYKNGILTVRVHQHEAARPRQISVSVA